MQVFIDNEEVVSARSITINKQLANTSSVILNNVYPKSWENDKDYVSRFYMPKDYSRCVIRDDTEKEKQLTKYITFYSTNAYADDTDLIIKYNEGSLLEYSAIIPNEKYKLIVTATTDTYIYEADSFSVNSELTRLQEIHTGRNEVILTPTKNYIVFTGKDENLSTITSNFTLYFYSANELYELNNNICEKENRLLRYVDNQIVYNTSYGIRYMRVVPNHYYTFIIKSSGGGKYVCETDSLNIDVTTDRLQYIYINGSAPFTIKPTKNYIVWDNTMEITTIKTVNESDLLFSGVVKNSGNINLNPRYPHYATLQILDYETFLNEGDTLKFVLERQTISSALQKIIENLDGFAIGEIQIENDEEIGPYNCNEKTPSDVFNYIAEITGSIWYATTIDNDITLINFYSTDNLTKLNDIKYTQEYFKNNQIINIEYSYNTNDYRNKQAIISKGATSNITQSENITYTGEALETIYDISSVVSIKSGTKAYTVASDIARANGISANFYYTSESNRISVNTNVPTGTVFTVQYYSLVDSRQVAYNQTEIDRINEQTGKNGIISRYEKRNDVSNETALSKIAQTYLDYKGVPEITLIIKSYKEDLFSLGNVVFFDGPIADLKTNYLVIEKQIEMIVTGEQQEVFYTYTLSSSFNDENAINFFDNQRRKLSGDIKEGDFIPRYIDIPSSTNIIFYDLNFEEIEIPTSVLDGELDFEI